MNLSSRHSRREFLRGRAAVRALADAAGNIDNEQSRSSLHAPRSLSLLSVRRRAMACEFEVQLAAGRDDDAMDHILSALDLVESLEGQLTIYRADSEVVRMNRRAADGPVQVEPRLFGLFQSAERLYRETGGAVDLTSGPLSEVWGFSRRQGRLPGDAEIAAAMERVGMDKVILDATHCTVAFRQRDVSLHVNCIGKGYALDRVAEQLAERGVNDYLLHGGRSSVLARGRCPGSKEPGWPIGLRHPLRPAQRLGEFHLRDQALGTSGSGTQFFNDAGRRYGHLLDPRTGRPAEGVYTATVIAPTAAEADALSTAFYIMGPEKTGEYCSGHPGIGAVLVCRGQHEGDARVRTFGLDGPDWKPSIG